MDTAMSSQEKKQDVKNKLIDAGTLWLFFRRAQKWFFSLFLSYLIKIVFCIVGRTRILLLSLIREAHEQVMMVDLEVFKIAFALVLYKIFITVCIPENKLPIIKVYDGSLYYNCIIYTYHIYILYCYLYYKMPVSGQTPVVADVYETMFWYSNESQ